MATNNKSNRVAPRLKTLDAYLDTPILEYSNSLEINKIQLPSKQPRHYFDLEKLDQLVKSVSEHGILEPILVRQLKNGQYELVAGERRLRAAQIVGLKEIPVVLKELNDLEALQVSLMENLQREDLSPVEETEAVLELLAITLQIAPSDVVSILHQTYNAKQRGLNLNQNVLIQLEKIETMLSEIGRFNAGTFRSSRLPLLNLPNEILDFLRAGKIEYTKAQAISRVKDKEFRNLLLKEAIELDLSLKKIRERIKEVEGETKKEIPLQTRMHTLYKRFQKSNLWADTKKKRRIESLLLQLESLLPEDKDS